MEETLKVLQVIIEELDDREDDWARDAYSNGYNSGIRAAKDLIQSKIESIESLIPKNKN